MGISRLSSLTEKIKNFGKDDRRIDEYYFMGFKILVGKNAISNEALLKEHIKANPHFVWLHALSSKGAHVVICANLVDIPETVMRRAAGLASKYSYNGQAEVTWSELIDVYKPHADMVGVWKTWKTTNVIRL